MKHKSPTLLAVHSLVRAILMQHPVDQAYLVICKSLFFSFISNTSQTKSTRDNLDLQNICDQIYLFDDEELSYTSCYSTSITAQIIAMTHGIPTTIVIGIKKQDKKLVGHAWLEYTQDRQLQIANPGNVTLLDFTEIKRLKPETTIQTWMKQRAILDNASAVLP